jgi:hypothetical protein
VILCVFPGFEGLETLRVIAVIALRIYLLKSKIVSSLGSMAS